MLAGVLGVLLLGRGAYRADAAAVLAGVVPGAGALGWWLLNLIAARRLREPGAIIRHGGAPLFFGSLVIGVAGLTGLLEAILDAVGPRTTTCARMAGITSALGLALLAAAAALLARPARRRLELRSLAVLLSAGAVATIWLVVAHWTTLPPELGVEP